jgi:transposase
LLRLREVTAEEERAIGRLARSRTAPVRMVERARIVDLAAHGWRVPGIAAELEVSQRTVRRWVKRFTAQGLAGLGDAPRSGRPATYPTAAVGALIAASLTNPQELGLPFGSWTLDRLASNTSTSSCQAVRKASSRPSERAERQTLGFLGNGRSPL